VSEAPTYPSTESSARPRNGLGTAALVTGPMALAMVLSFTLFPLGGLVALAACILGAFAVERAQRGAATNRTHAVAGLICGGLALVLAIVFTVRTGTWVFEHQGDLTQLGTCMNTAADDAAVVDCMSDFLEQVE
jgi:hypothetical protein